MICVRFLSRYVTVEFINKIFSRIWLRAFVEAGLRWHLREVFYASSQIHWAFWNSPRCKLRMISLHCMTQFLRRISPRPFKDTSTVTCDLIPVIEPRVQGGRVRYVRHHGSYGTFLFPWDFLSTFPFCFILFCPMWTLNFVCQTIPLCTTPCNFGRTFCLRPMILETFSLCRDGSWHDVKASSSLF